MGHDQHGIVREIGIDAAHRVPAHGSKCRRLHGHRYTIEAHCLGPLAEAGEQEGMVLDFGFLKEEMMSLIDSFCDHATILWIEDPLVRLLVPDLNMDEMRNYIKSIGYAAPVGDVPVRHGPYEAQGLLPFKLYLVPFAPTAENLARHWFQRLQPRVVVRSGSRASLKKMVVYETPNCRAVYPI